MRGDEQREVIGLVGCVKSKQHVATPASQLYTSPLFRGRRRWVERSCDRWFILSAKHGLVHPDDVIEPYDETLTDKPSAGRRLWSQRVVAQLRDRLGALDAYAFELHAGQTYVDYGLRRSLLEAGASVTAPAEGLRQGEQLVLYSARRLRSDEQTQ